MSKLLLVPLDDIVVFPNMSVTLTVDVDDEERVLLVPKHEGEYAKVGTVAEVTDTVRLPGGGHAVALNGLHRAIAGAAETDPRGRLFVEVEERPDEEPPRVKISELETEYRAVVEEILELRGDDGRIAAFLRSISEAGALADTAGYSPDLTFEQKVQLLETVDVIERLELALNLQRERLALMQVRRRIRDDVNAGMEKQQREYVLRRQLESIRKELGEDETSVVEEFRQKIAESTMPDHVREQAERELGRFERMGEQLARGPDDPQLPRLAARRAVGRALRGAARPAGDARDPRRRPRRPRGRQGPHRRVHRRAQAPRGARHRAGQEVGRDPDPDRAARHRQDVDRRVDRTLAQPRVRPHVARRRP